MTEFELGWLVGYLEGEAAFTLNGATPRVYVKSTDSDVVSHLAELWRSKVRGPRPNGKNPNAQPCYETQVDGTKAVEVMLTLLSRMGLRRKKRILEILQAYFTRRQQEPHPVPVAVVETPAVS